MPRTTADKHHAQEVERRLLHARGLAHLRARKHGSAVIVESGPQADATKHFRVRRDKVHLWCLDIANHRGTWEPTPYRDALERLTQLVVEQFPWTVENVFDPERTSDPEY